MPTKILCAADQKVGAGKTISAVRQSIQRFFKDGLHYISFDAATSVGGTPRGEHAAGGRTIFEIYPLCRAAKVCQALTRQVLKFQEVP